MQQFFDYVNLYEMIKKNNASKLKLKGKKKSVKVFLSPLLPAGVAVVLTKDFPRHLLQLHTR